MSINTKRENKSIDEPGAAVSIEGFHKRFQINLQTGRFLILRRSFCPSNDLQRNMTPCYVQRLRLTCASLFVCADGQEEARAHQEQAGPEEGQETAKKVRVATKTLRGRQTSAKEPGANDDDDDKEEDEDEEQQQQRHRRH